MYKYTSHADIIEESIGVELAPKNIKAFQNLTNTQLNKLGEDLATHSRARYLRLPVIDTVKGDYCALLHPEGRISENLPVIPWGTGHKVSASPDELLGSLYLTLTYFPRVAIHDGLEYFLDYKNPRENERFITSINNILGFYCFARELIRTEELIILPRTLWLDVSANGLGAKKLYEDDVQDVWGAIPAQLDFMKAFQKERIERERDVDIDNKLADEVYDTVERIEANKINNRVKELNLLGATLNYTPVIESSDEKMFCCAQRLHNRCLREYTEGQRIISAKTLIPNYAKIESKEFLSVRGSDGFIRFRQTISDISGKIVQDNLTSKEQKEFIDSLLAGALDGVEKDINKSGTMKEVFTNTAVMGMDTLTDYIGGVDWTEIAFSRSLDALDGVGSPLYDLYKRNKKLGPMSRILSSMIYPHQHVLDES